jgi:hypothetical protein
MEKIRIKYFGLTDLSAAYYIEQSKKVLKEYNTQSNVSNINDIIELFNIDKYIKTDIELGIEKTASQLINKCISTYLSSISSIPLCILFKEVDNDYHDEFWEFFTKYKIFNRFTDVEFTEFLQTEHPFIRSILQNEKLVAVYDECIGEYFIEDVYNAIIILDAYEIENLYNQKKIFSPKSLTNEKKEQLIIKYIESEHPSINYLEIITSILNRDEIRLSDRTKLLAKRRLENETELFFQKNTGHTTGVSIDYSQTQEESCSYIQDEGITRLTYSYNWIKENLDYNTLFNNFIYLFEFIDEQGRITLVSKHCEIGAIERSFTTWAKNNYPTGWSFQHKEHISDLQLYSYLNLLSSFQINIEEMIQWFFNSYLTSEFSINNYDINITSENTTYLEKCRILAPEIESILKKYNMIVEDGYIDSGLLEIASNPLLFSSCKSLFSLKYIYPNSSDFQTVCYFLFSDQSMLNYIEKEKKSYKSFFDILLTRKVKISDYQEYQHKNLNWLVENSYLKFDEHKNIIFNEALSNSQRIML